MADFLPGILLNTSLYLLALQVREINGIELILDCSPIDGKNPFISEWVKLAIRNILIENHENQSIVSSISKDGKMDKTVLEEIGVQIQDM